MVRAGERNTWPFIPRIKAHCLVEMSLDSCVQKLRRQIAQDSANAKAKFMRNEQTGTDKMNRLPSFYTTRSLVNLSGLSVSDPLPTYRPITSGGQSTSNPAISSRSAVPSPLAVHPSNGISTGAISTGAMSSNGINANTGVSNNGPGDSSYGVGSDLNGNLSKKSSTSSMQILDGSPIRSSNGASRSSLHNNVSDDALKAMISIDQDDLFASVPAPDMFLSADDGQSKSKPFRSPRHAATGGATLGVDVSGAGTNTDRNGGYSIGSPRDATGLDPAGGSSASLYASVPGPDLLLSDNPRSSLVSSRYRRIPKAAQPDSADGEVDYDQLTEEQCQQQYLDLTLTSANLATLHKPKDSPEKKSEITK